MKQHTINFNQWPFDKIISVAGELKKHGSTAVSTGEQIAAAFVLNQMKFLPANYKDVIEAWDRLDDWQVHVIIIKRDAMHLIKET